MDWQTLTTKEMDYFLEKTVLPALNQIIGTPLSELGKQSSYWYGCDCERNKCDSCWMEKSRQDLIEENIFQLPLETTDGTINLEVKHKRIP